METANLTRKLKIFCPTHQSVFEVDEKPQIICEIKEHALSNNFPRAEFWEYCCDCQTFSPSRFGTGGKAGNACPHCERTTARRFLCNECKIVAFDSDEETKGKIYEIDAAQGVKPDCPGCHKIFVGAKFLGHKCTDIDGVLLTQLAECPFCQKPTLEKNKPPKKVEPLPTNAATTKFDSPTASTQCRQCGHWGKPDRAVCGKCGAQIGSLGTGVAAGTATPKTQLLGSICPNCGAGNESDCVFCVNCGQGLKAVAPQRQDETETVTVASPRFPANMPLIPVNQPNTFSSVQTPAAQDIKPLTKSADSKMILFSILGLIAFFIVFGLLGYNSNKSTSTVINTNNSNNSNPYSYIIGKEAKVVNNDVKIRSSASPNASEIGVLYMNTKVKILDAKKSDTGTLWYRVKVIDYGCSKNANLGCGKDNPNDKDEGWAYSEYIRY